MDGWISKNNLSIFPYISVIDFPTHLLLPVRQAKKKRGGGRSNQADNKQN